MEDHRLSKVVDIEAQVSLMPSFILAQLGAGLLVVNQPVTLDHRLPKLVDIDDH